MSDEQARYATLADLAEDLTAMGRFSPDYWDRMMHRVPDAPSVDSSSLRMRF